MDGSKNQGAKGGSSSAYNALGLGSFSLGNNNNSRDNKQQFIYDLK